MRIVLTLLTLGLLLLPGSSDYRQPLIETAVRTTLTARALSPYVRTVGRLRFIEGWSLSAPHPSFGGFSTLRVDGDTVTTISDLGTEARFQVPRDRERVPLKLSRPTGCQIGVLKEGRDLEAAAHGPDGTRWYAFESLSRLCRVAPDGRWQVGTPSPIGRWDWRTGAESLVRLADGRFVALEEGPRTDPRPREVAVFSGDPLARDTTVAMRRLALPPEYRPTDAALMPDGRLLVLSRRIAVRWPPFSARLDLFDLSTAATLLRGEPVAHLVAPFPVDNYEGVSVTNENGQTFVWLISDDNLLIWQRTLLVRFRLD